MKLLKKQKKAAAAAAVEGAGEDAKADSKDGSSSSSTVRKALPTLSSLRQGLQEQASMMSEISKRGRDLQNEQSATRTQLEASVAKSLSQSVEEEVAVQMEQRAKHLRDQRDKLIAKKKAERVAALAAAGPGTSSSSSASSSGGDDKATSPSSGCNSNAGAATLSPGKGGAVVAALMSAERSESKADEDRRKKEQERSERHLEARRDVLVQALAKKVKAELLVSAGQEDTDMSDIDRRLRQLELQRQETKRKEGEVKAAILARRA